jgi:hypothetical protein
MSNGSAYKNLWNGETEISSNTFNNNSTTTTTTTTTNNNAELLNSKNNCGIGDGGISYSYLDPEKKHKVADMTLKAIQKKALLSYYERHAGKLEGSSSGPSHTNTNKGAVESNHHNNQVITINSKKTVPIL